MTDTVCDNARKLALAEKGQNDKNKHARNQRAQFAPRQERLTIV